jgi:hypothetical protein
LSGLIVDLPVRHCASCELIFIEDGRMYVDTDLCPRCGSDLSSAAREGGGGSVRTILSRAHVMATEDGFGLKDQDGFGLRITPTSRWD